MHLPKSYLTGVFAASVLASSVAAQTSDELQKRAPPSFAPITDADQLSSALNDLYTDAKYVGLGAAAGAALLSAIVPLQSPDSIEQLADDFQKIKAAKPQDIFEYGAQIILNGFAGQDFVDIFNAYAFDSSTFNINLRQPARPVYPRADPRDAPYSLTEDKLRQIIHIPPDFTYGKVQPVLFIPGTGAVAGQNFGPNFAKLLKQDGVGDPVYINIPTENLADIQLAAEYTAYAINYISGISNGLNVSTLSWSAGSLDGQWAFKYWPSTVRKTSNAIRISPDLHGTILARLLCPGFETPGCTPAIAQQLYDAKFINTLRNNGGDSAYVPTTNVYSIFDEIVQPQADPNASGSINDTRGVGVTNVELQSVCTAALPGGLPINDHEGVLINALAYELAKDALTHPGPGQLSRVDAPTQCEKFAADGLSLADIFATYALIPEAALAIIAFQPKSSGEPPIRAYAQKDVPAS